MEWLHGHVTCRVFGHKFTVQKMGGVMCARCRVFRPYRVHRGWKDYSRQTSSGGIDIGAIVAWHNKDLPPKS